MFQLLHIFTNICYCIFECNYCESKLLGCVWLFATLCNYTVHGTLQARILEWVFPSPGDLPNPGIKPRSPALQADSLPAETPGKTCFVIVWVFSFKESFTFTEKLTDSTGIPLPSISLLLASHTSTCARVSRLVGTSPCSDMLLVTKSQRSHLGSLSYIWGFFF